jgi:predicted RNA-binding protein YlqC (UPF0109 family)
MFELSVAPNETGRVIGRQGQVVNAMRTMLNVAAAKEGRRVDLEVIGPKERRRMLHRD